ncbi:hypothetical protein VSH64_13295 [Amycolatopsis rhabdoformis]|uniref:Uncharacterized protein n=1 Tax=Amycolatopsis rhabdoformis TaxID=1448059 RepID=A0ABZ1IHR8_9PSEU|nr:hypothetical protein [Amycolatopsis rhabdoformis]WSE33079.1 hypothetical protein VSH64_13295 [Amycolatopsis rhabdoformis]
MTYPPQQPGGYGGAGGYGQQPDPYGQSRPGPGQPPSGPQQQPGYPGGQPFGGQQQPGTWPPQGGYPQSGPQQQPGYPAQQPPPFGQPDPRQQGAPGQFGQQDPYRQGGGTQQYPQQDPYQQGGTQQFGQPDAFQQGGFGDQYGQPGGYQSFGGYNEQPPKKKKTGLIVGIAIGAVVVVGGAIGLVIGLSGDDKGKTDTAAPPAPPAASSPGAGAPHTSAPTRPSTSGSTPSTGGADSPAPGGTQSAQELFQAAATDFTSGDGSALAGLACRSLYNGGAVDIPKTTIELTGAAQETGDTASVRYKATQGTRTANGTMTSKREAGVWCLVDAQADKQ